MSSSSTPLSLMARTRNGLLTWQRAGWFVMVAAGSLLVALSVWRRGLWYDLPLVFTVGFTSLALFFGALLTLAITSAEGSVLKRLLCSRLLKFSDRKRLQNQYPGGIRYLCL